MANFRPSAPFSLSMVLLLPTYKNAYGVAKKEYPSIAEALDEVDANDKPINLFFGNFKTYGGTERNVDGLYVIEDTANVETWFRPDITSDCRIGVIETGAIYEIWGEPENINMRNQYLKLKLKRYKGGA